MSTDTVELELNLVAETPMAYGVTDDDPDDPVIWLPKSRVEVVSRAAVVGQTVTLEVPEWLAVDKGLA